MTSVDDSARSAQWTRLPTINKSVTPRSRHLWWMYLLVVFALAGMGAGAAQALFDTHNLGGISNTVTCLARHGLTNFDGASQVSARTGSQYAACVDPFNRRHGMAMLIGAGLMLAAAWALMLGGGFGIRWSLRRGRTKSTLTPAAQDMAKVASDRFDAWCEVWRLSGRRRPRLLLTVPGTSIRQAFTTGLPLARPLVVVPMSYAYTEPTPFDVAVLHELAHIRSRDLLWASWVWWAGWLNIPMLLLALSSTLNQSWVLSRYSASLWLSAALSAAVLVLRAALLRRRELAADRYAVEVLEDIGALRAALGREADGATATATSAEPATSGPAVGSLARLGGLLARYVRQLTASHPTTEARVDADPASLDRWEGGFAVTAATSVIAMFTFQSVYLALIGLSGLIWADPTLPAELVFAASSLLWACVIIPAWIRRAEAAARTGSSPTWWGPVAGMALGLPLGYGLPIPGASTAVGASQFTGHLPLLYLLLAIVMAGAGALAAGLASNVAAANWPASERMWALIAAVTTAAIALTTALSVTTTILGVHLLRASTAHDRTLLVGLGDNRIWRFIPLLLLIGFALAARKPVTIADPTGKRSKVPSNMRARIVSGILPRACWPLIAPAAVVGGLGAALSWQLRISSSRPSDTIYLLLYQRFWICALAGWTTVAAALLTGRSDPRAPDNARLRPLSRLPAALTAGLLTAILAGLLQFIYTAALGYRRDFHMFQESLRLPMWLLLVVIIVSLPWLLLAANLADRVRHRPLSGTGNISVILGTGIIAGVLTVTVVSGGVSPLTVAPHDYSRGISVTAETTPGQSEPTVPARPPEAAPGPDRNSEPGRLLSRTAAAKALANVQQLLPAGRRLIKNRADSSGITLQPTTCQELFDHDDATEKARPRTADITRTYTFPAQGTTSGGIELEVALTSYRTPMRDLSFLRNEATKCPHFTLLTNTAAGKIHGSLSEKNPPTLPYPADRSDVTYIGHTNSIRVVTTTLTDTVTVGHNFASAAITYSYFNIPPPESTRRYPAQLAAAALTTIIKNLEQ
jgi:Zn-dependent protease with chaperone function